MAPVKPEPPSKEEYGLDDLINKSDTVSGITKREPVKKYRSGRLKVKPWGEYRKISKRNATESPLLRLPGELRNKIWAYAVGGYDVNIEESPSTIKLSYTLPSHTEQVTALTKFHNSQTGPNFKLPQVCRQIYWETGTLPYSLNTFRFPLQRIKNPIPRPVERWSCKRINTMKLWVLNRCPAQLKAIISIQPHDDYISDYVSRREKAFRFRFPNIKTVILKKGTQKGYLMPGSDPYFESSIFDAREKNKVKIEWLPED